MTAGRRARRPPVWSPRRRGRRRSRCPSRWSCATPTSWATSMEVGVRVEAEDVVSGRRTHTSSAYLVFVALDEHGRPRPVPPLEPETEQERRRQAEAKIRREIRLARAEAIRRQRGAAEVRG